MIKGCRFDDLPLGKITGFKRDEERLIVIMEHQVVTCVDPLKSQQLLDIGIGGLVQLFNVKNHTFVTSSSGIRQVFEMIPPLSPPPITISKNPEKWSCIVCAQMNFPSKSVCQSCSHTRKQGPMYKDFRHYKLKHVPRQPFQRLAQWMCRKCRFRDNFCFHNKCTNCGERAE